MTAPRAPRRDDRAVELRVPAAGERHELAVGGDDLQRRDRRREVADPIARSVGRGGARPGHRDVRQRGQVVQREPGRVQGSASSP